MKKRIWLLSLLPILLSSCSLGEYTYIEVGETYSNESGFSTTSNDEYVSFEILYKSKNGNEVDLEISSSGSLNLGFSYNSKKIQYFYCNGERIKEYSTQSVVFGTRIYIVDFIDLKAEITIVLNKSKFDYLGLLKTLALDSDEDPAAYDAISIDIK